MSKSEEDFAASVQLLDATLELYDKGLKDAYRAVATELRKLLCDGNSLLPRVRPNFRLHKLHWTEVLEGCPPLTDGLEVMMPGRLTVSANGVYGFELLFAKTTALMSIADWVQQPIFSPQITIRELIRSVADKEAVHSDPDYNETLVKAKLVKYVRDDSHIPCIVAFGKYLTAWLRDSGATGA
jgi:hypothetical protein